MKRGMILSAAGALMVMTMGCSRSEPSGDDVDQAYETAQEQVSDASFEDVGDPSDCTEDCSGHDAGFDWARDQGITDPSECGGKSQSFIEGCEAYASAVETQAEDQLSSDDE